MYFHISIWREIKFSIWDLTPNRPTFRKWKKKLPRFARAVKAWIIELYSWREVAEPTNLSFLDSLQLHNILGLSCTDLRKWNRWSINKTICLQFSKTNSFTFQFLCQVIRGLCRCMVFFKKRKPLLLKYLFCISVPFVFIVH